MPGTLSTNSSRVSAGGHASNANRLLSLSLSAPGSQKSDERDGRTYRTLPMELFVQSPLMCIFVRRTRPAMLLSSPFTHGNSHDYAISALV